VRGKRQDEGTEKIAEQKPPHSFGFGLAAMGMCGKRRELMARQGVKIGKSHVKITGVLSEGTN